MEEKIHFSILVSLIDRPIKPVISAIRFRATMLLCLLTREPGRAIDRALFGLWYISPPWHQHLDPYSTTFAHRDGVDFGFWPTSLNFGREERADSERLRERKLGLLHRNPKALLARNAAKGQKRPAPAPEGSLSEGGRSQKTAELRCLLARSPATRLRCTPRQRISENDHGAQMWSNTSLVRWMYFHTRRRRG